MKKILGILILFALSLGIAEAAPCDNYAWLWFATYSECMSDPSMIWANEATASAECWEWLCSSCPTEAEKKQCKYDECMPECTSTNPWEKWADYCNCKCNGWITLNTDVPFIGRCILLGSSNTSGPNSTEVTQLSAFPRLMKALTNIALSLILVTSLIMIIAGGVMIASSGANSGGYDQGKKMIRKVIVWLILLWASGIILALINPNFFG